MGGSTCKAASRGYTDPGIQNNSNVSITEYNAIVGCAKHIFVVPTRKNEMISALSSKPMGNVF